MEPKKSARLAQKRKLKEESSPENSQKDKDKSPRSPLTSSCSKPIVSPGQTIVHGRSPPLSSLWSPTKSVELVDPSDLGGIEGFASSVFDDSLGQEEVGFSDEERWMDHLDSLSFSNSGHLGSESSYLDEIHNASGFGRNRHEQFNFPLENSPGKGPISASLQDALRIRTQKLERRRFLARQKKELDKKNTLDRLLKKQQPKLVKNAKFKGSRIATEVPMIRYHIKPEVTTISFPVGLSLPILEEKKPRARLPNLKTIPCGVEGCTNIRKYNCSKTNVPLCSLECYKKNLLFKPKSN